MKYRGIFLQTEIYTALARRLHRGRPPAGRRHPRHGFYVQGSVARSEEARGLRSDLADLWRQEAPGSTTARVLGGMNFYPADTRNPAVNLQFIHVNRSPVSGTFGYYVGGPDGHRVPAFSVFF